MGCYRGRPVRPEGDAHFSYVYTNGNALLHFPQAGIGRFVVWLRMGGPSGRLPVRAHLESGTQPLDLGAVQQLRVYHLFLQSNDQGDIPLYISSNTVQLNQDPRHLVPLLQHVGVQSLGQTSPPRALLVSTPIILCLLWLAIAQLPAPSRWKILLLIFVILALCVTYAICRGRIPIQAWWIGIGLSAVVGMGLSRSDARPFLRSLPGIACVFVVWRVALWLVGGTGLWYSSVIYRYGRTVAFSFGKTIFNHEAFFWRTFAAAWISGTASVTRPSP